MAIRLTWLGHASVQIKSPSTTIYIDPWKLSSSSPNADIVLLTHDHYDHYSEADIKAVSDASTAVVAPMSASLVTDRTAPGKLLTIKNVTIQAVPAYNMEKAFHPRANNWVGYVVTILGRRIYHTGDTDRIPEMKGLSVDVAFIPVGGTYTMGPKEAALAVKDIGVSIAVPIHYADIVGSTKDAEAFASQCTSDVRILDPGSHFEIEENS